MLAWCASASVPPRAYADRFAEQDGHVCAQQPAWGNWFKLVNVRQLVQQGNPTDQLVALAQSGVQLGVDEIAADTARLVDWARVGAALRVRALFAVGDRDPATYAALAALAPYGWASAAPELYVIGSDLPRSYEWRNDMLTEILAIGGGCYRGWRLVPIFNVADAPQYGGAYSSCFPNAGWKNKFVVDLVRRLYNLGGEPGGPQSPREMCLWLGYETPASLLEFQIAKMIGTFAA